MLLADFYTIEILHETTPGEYTATVTLNAAHPLYAGHFPGNPVVPGCVPCKLSRSAASVPSAAD